MVSGTRIEKSLKSKSLKWINRYNILYFIKGFIIKLSSLYHVRWLIYANFEIIIFSMCYVKFTFLPRGWQIITFSPLQRIISLLNCIYFCFVLFSTRFFACTRNALKNDQVGLFCLRFLLITKTKSSLWNNNWDNHYLSNGHFMLFDLS